MFEFIIYQCWCYTNTHLTNFNVLYKKIHIYIYNLFVAKFFFLSFTGFCIHVIPFKLDTWWVSQNKSGFGTTRRTTNKTCISYMKHLYLPQILHSSLLQKLAWISLLVYIYRPSHPHYIAFTLHLTVIQYSMDTVSLAAQNYISLYCGFLFKAANHKILFSIR